MEGLSYQGQPVAFTVGSGNGTDVVDDPPLKRTAVGQPYLSWCLVVRNCEETLEDTLVSLRRRSPEAEIVVVDTCSRDRTPEIAQRYADVFEVYRGPRGDWDESMYAVDDMKSARQRSFEIASGTWRGWADGDDVVEGGEAAVKLLRQNARWAPMAAGATYEERVDERGEATSAMGIEEVLREFERRHPDVAMIRCPYLYQKDADGNALQWLERERFVRWTPGRFRWAEEAHEVLVPTDPNDVQRPAYVWHLLWVHQKKFTPQDLDFSKQRHSAIMLAQYEAGQVTARRCKYLSGFAAVMWPHRELEFLDAWYAHAWNDVDRYQALMGRGAYYAKRGLVWRSREAYAAAQSIRPLCPDAYYAAGQSAFEAEDWAEAAVQWRRGVAIVDLPMEAETTPRQHAVDFPLRLAYALRLYARQASQGGRPESECAQLLDEASQLCDRVRQRPELRYMPAADQAEADAWWRRARNDGRAQVVAHCLRQVWDYLRDNDEPQKAVELAAVVPWNLLHSPVATELDAWARRVERHVNDPEAYAEFYGKPLETGFVATPEDLLDLEHSHERVRWIVSWLRENAAAARILEVGTSDGIVGVPILRELPRVNYVGCDVSQDSLDHFRRHLERISPAADWDGRVQLMRTQMPPSGSFDVVVAGEIVEHVDDPIYWLRDLVRLTREGGALLLTTPLGSFDLGKPPERTAHGTIRSELGHLRAYSPWSLTVDLRLAGWVVDEVSSLQNQTHVGDALLARATRRRLSKPSVAVCVPHALWEWCGSKVDRDGIGASEETIVRLGEEMAKDRTYDVYGPVPYEEVYRGVGYFERPAVRRVDHGTKLVVSRSPGYVRQLDAWTGAELPAVLWLQDTHYPDLNAEVADRYEWIVTVSEWHRQLTIEAHGLRPDQHSKVVVIKNWLQRSHFQPGIDAGWAGVKKRDHFVYMSSPDRGLVKLLKLWPRIRELAPEATLSIFYGWRGASRLGGGHNPAWNQRYLRSRVAYEELRHQPGVTEVGMVNHYVLAAELMKAGVWAYPTVFGETCCANAMKARAAGAVPVTTDYAGLRETAGCSAVSQVVSESLIDPSADDACGGGFREGYDERFLLGVKAALETSDAERLAMARVAVEDEDFEARRAKWEEVLA